MNEITLYIPHYQNEELLNKVIDSFINQVDKIFVINSSLTPLKFIHKKIIDYIPSDSLCFESALNCAIRDSHNKGNQYMLWAHSDLIALDNNVINSIFKKYEEIKNTKWGMVYGHYDHICLFNSAFFYNENIWGDSNFLFTGYFGDNHRNRLMMLRGYQFYNSENVNVNHVGSQTIQLNPIMNRKNGLTFYLWQQLYISLWGGGPGQETINDPTCNGLYPI